MRFCFRGSAVIFTTFSILQPILADWQFKSRPDLAPPRLNITIPASKDVEKGYLFIAPFKVLPEGTPEPHGPLQAAPYIFTDSGDLVWSGFTYFSISATNFQAARWKGKDVLFSFEGSRNAAYGHGHGHITLLDQHYETIRELRAGHHRLSDKHEFNIINETTALLQIYHPVPWDLSPYGADEEQQWIVDALFQELDIETGKVLFEWRSLDHVLPGESYFPLNPGQAGAGYNSSDAWDYFHINSVDKRDDGSYLVSARDASTVYRINGTTGEIIWRLGGKLSNFTLGHDVEFHFQHHARWFSQSKDGKKEVITLYDNSAWSIENGRGGPVHLYPYSRGKIITLDTETWQATLVQQFIPPDKLLAESKGSTQILPNGNALVNWGSAGALTEFLPDGKPIFHAYVDSGELAFGIHNYRGFRFNWTGIPNEEPSIVSLKNESSTSIYVSWNGDTETNSWAFYGKTRDGHLKLLGEKKKTSFETVLIIHEDVQNVKAEALSKHRNVLVTTEVVKSEVEIREFGTGFAKAAENKELFAVQEL